MCFRKDTFSMIFSCGFCFLDLLYEPLCPAATQALTSEITSWVESGLLQIGVLHIASFPKSSPIRRGFKVSRQLRSPLDRPRGLVGANLVWLFLARPNLASVAAEPNFFPTLTSTKSQLILFLLRRPFPGEIGLIRLAVMILSIPAPFLLPPLCFPTRLA